MQDFNLLHLLFPECFPIILASSVCKSLQCLICALVQWGQRWPLVRLTCSVVWWEERYTANKYCWHVWGVLTVDGPHWVFHSTRRCVLPRSTLLSLQGALQGHCSKWALHFMHFPGLHCPGSWVLHRGTDADVLYIVYPSQVRAAQATRCFVNTLSQVGHLSYSPAQSPPLGFPDVLWEQNSRCAMCLLLGVDLRLWQSSQMSTVKVLRKRRLATGTLLTVWCKMQSLGSSLVFAQSLVLWAHQGSPFGDRAFLGRGLFMSLWRFHGLGGCLILAPSDCPQGIQAQSIP